LLELCMTQLDQRSKAGAQADQSGQAADATALGPFTCDETQQRHGGYAPQRRVLDAETALQVLRHAAHALQRLQDLAGFVADFLTMHFHAQTDQCLAHFPA